MSKITPREFIQRVGWDGITIGILGFVAIGMTIYDFIGGNQLSPSLLVGILGLFLVEIILQRNRFEKAKEETIHSLKGVKIQRFVDDNEFANAKYRTLLTTNSFVYDTELCKPKLSSTENIDSESPFRKSLHDKIKNGKLTYKYLEVIYSRAQFENVLEKVFEFHKYSYYIGYFVGAPDVIPVLNIMIFDDKHFFIGGYYGSSARGESKPLHIQQEEIGQMLRQYFDYLWSRAKLLNERQTINWDEVYHCALGLGYSNDELNQTVATIAEKVGLSEIKEF